MKIPNIIYLKTHDENGHQIEKDKVKWDDKRTNDTDVQYISHDYLKERHRSLLEFIMIELKRRKEKI